MIFSFRPVVAKLSFACVYFCQNYKINGLDFSFENHVKVAHCAEDFLSIKRALFLPHSSRVPIKVLPITKQMDVSIPYLFKEVAASPFILSILHCTIGKEDIYESVP